MRESATYGERGSPVKQGKSRGMSRDMSRDMSRAGMLNYSSQGACPVLA